MFEIDLHNSFSVPEAIEQLNHELFLVYQRREREVRIIYGIGTGALRQAVLLELQKNTMVRSAAEDDVGGSCVVTL